MQSLSHPCHFLQGSPSSPLQSEWLMPSYFSLEPISRVFSLKWSFLHILRTLYKFCTFFLQNFRRYAVPCLHIELKTFKHSACCIIYYFFPPSLINITYHVNILSNELIKIFFLDHSFECVISSCIPQHWALHCSIKWKLLVFTFWVFQKLSSYSTSWDIWEADSHFYLDSDLHLLVTFSCRDLCADSIAVHDWKVFSISAWKVTSLSSFIFFL